MRKRLTKSRSNIVISGVLGGIGEYLNLDPTILRVIFIVITFLGVGSPVLLYLILMFVMPTDRSGAASRGQDYYQSYHGYRPNDSRPSQRPTTRKEAEKINDDDEWSDF